MSSHPTDPRPEGSTPEGSHPEDGLLLDHLAKKVQGQALEQLLDHLAECDPCVDRLLDLQALLPQKTARDEKGDAPADFELKAAWRELRSQLATDEQDPKATAHAPPAGSRAATQSWWSRVETMRAAAAVLLVISGLLTARVVQLTDRGQELEQRLQTPQADVPVLYLESVRTEGRAEVIPAGDGVALLMISPSDPRQFEAYDARLLDGDQIEIWQAGGLALSEHGSLRIALPRSLPAGTYTLTLEGRIEGRLETLESHRLDLQ